MFSKEDLPSAVKILQLRARALNLNLNHLERNCFNQTKEFRQLDSNLDMLIKSMKQYDFLSQINSGSTLLVGEGNLSFSVSLLNKLSYIPHFVASTYESYEELPEFAQSNVTILKKSGIKVLHEIDATRLHKLFHQNSFNTIIFQFPHSGSREGIDGVSANYILAKKFIISALKIIKRPAVILITIVDSVFYKNIFRFNELADELGIRPPVKYKFDPKNYPEYEHTMTHQDQSAIDGYSKFATYEFRK